MNLQTLNELKPLNELGFGKFYTPHMIEARYSNGAWQNWTLKEVQSLELHPGAKSLHYAQEIFEGLKAYKQHDGSVAMFRPTANIQRMSRSADWLAMPAYPEDEFLAALKKLVAAHPQLVPDLPGSLYLRPTMVGSSASLGVAPASDYLFYILASPVGGYFGDVESSKPATVSIWISDQHVRAAPGGLGAAKTGANYAASLRAVAHSKKLGFDNVLFLDAVERRNLEELSGMNVFVVDQGQLKTPPLGDTILAGITRDSLIKIARHKGYKVEECEVDVEDLLAGIAKGQISEVFACGTASVVTSIRELGWKGERLKVADGQAGPVATALYQELSGMHNGTIAPLSPDWIVNC